MQIYLALALTSVLMCSATSVEDHLHAKRKAPSGFTGVRGKKSVSETDYEPVSDGNAFPDMAGSGADKRAPSGFMGMRGKKLATDQTGSYADEQSMYPELTASDREKKEYEYNIVDNYKRAPSGFMGVRGKKPYQWDPYPFTDSFVDKRAPSGFVGMRGKKEYDEIMETEKRAQMSGFFGMRGKKMPGRSSFFGMRGKKYPLEFRGKFVGVRGKKSFNDIDDDYVVSEDIARLADELDLNQLMLLLTENDQNGDVWNKRIGSI